MKEGSFISKPQEHLNLNIKGAKPIIVCVGSFDDYYNFQKPPIKKSFHEQSKNVHNVAHESSLEYFEKRNFKNGGRQTYVFSTPDNYNKFSEGFFDCTGIIVAGVDKETGENISFLSHQDPKTFLHNQGIDFIESLKQRLIELKDRCIPGTIDAVIVGGNYFDGKDSQGFSIKKKYLDSIKLISTETENILGFEPVVVNGPKTTMGKDNIYYDNENRRIYFLRFKVNPSTGSFTQSDIEEEKKEMGMNSYFFSRVYN